MRKAMQVAFLIIFVFVLSVITTPNASATVGPINGHTLITEPDDGTSFLVNQIKAAKSTIKVTIYNFDGSSPLYNALIDAAQSGVKVDITYNYHSFGYAGQPASRQADVTSFMQSLTTTSKNIQTHPASDIYDVTHQKVIIIDEKAAFICSFNFTHSYFGGTRDFAIYTTVHDEVNELVKVAEADFTDGNKNQKGAVYPGKQLTTPDLIWSDAVQGNSRTKLAKLIQTAQNSIYIYQEFVEDQDMTTVIVDAMKANPKLDVRIIAPEDSQATSGKNTIMLTQIKQAGGKVIEVPDSTATLGGISNTKLYVHAKMMLVDYNPDSVQPTGAAYIGSINFSTPSLDKNRENGIIVKEPQILAAVYSTFMSDWNANGGNYPQ